MLQLEIIDHTRHVWKVPICANSLQETEQEVSMTVCHTVGQGLEHALFTMAAHRVPKYSSRQCQRNPIIA